jgi:hypothetical protein
MTKAYLTPPKGIKLHTGGKMRLGQIIGGNPMFKNPQRPLNTSLHPRDGRTQTEFAPVINHRSRTAHGPGVITGNAHEDEPLEKTYSGKSVPVHPGMTDKQRAAVHPVANDPKMVLAEASNLGRKAS